MKIAFYLPDLDGGGAQRVIINCANYIASHRSHVEVFMLVGLADGSYRAEVSNKISVIDLGDKRVSRNLFKLILQLNKIKPDLLMSTMSHANLIAIIASQFLRFKLKTFIRESNHLSISYSGVSNFKRKLIYFLIKKFYPLADHIFCPSQGVMTDLISIAPKILMKSSVLPNPTITPEIYTQSNENISLQLNPNSFVFLAIGRLTEQKDFSTLIDAFNIVHKSRPETILIILGEGNLRPKLESHITSLNLQNNIFMPGFTINPFPYLKNCHCFVLSSKWEGMPNVLIQAMAFGKTVVSTDCPSGPAEILDGGNLGYLCKVSDKLDLSDKMLLAMDRPFDSQKIIESVAQYKVEVGITKILHQL